jgi:hypothetical protein
VLLPRHEDGETALHIIATRQAACYTKPKHDGELLEIIVGTWLDLLIEDNKGRPSLEVAAACEKKEILTFFNNVLSCALRSSEGKVW